MSTAAPVTIKGRFFWKDDTRFLINGVIYQHHHGDRNTTDPIDDNQIKDLQRSIPFLKELGINTIIIHFIDSTKCRDAAMKLLAEAGIYVLPCLSAPHLVINRRAPFDSYTRELMQGCFGAIEAMEKYPNTLGLVVSREVIIDKQTTYGAPAVRAVVRDAKRYADLAFIRGQRTLPIGVIAMDLEPIQVKKQFDYFASGDDKECVDFFAFNNFAWAGNAAIDTTGYSDLIKQYTETPIPIFFSQYGNNTVRPRRFYETQAMYRDPTMLVVFSGGAVYEFFGSANNHGLVRREQDKNTGVVRLEPFKDFWNLKKSLQCSFMQPKRIKTAMSGCLSFAKAGKKPQQPKDGPDWQVTAPVPNSPIDWDAMLAEIIEDEEWVDISTELWSMTVDEVSDKMDNLV
ncbi:glycolipid anchored surface protein [Hypoxylon sp. NC1633]|nr:glycolipid anchored surface protein [Hypoxylon sp. NC1633]